MKDEKTIQAVRDYFWKLANNTMENGAEKIGMIATDKAQILDWVLDVEDWGLSKSFAGNWKQVMKEGK